MKKIITLIIFLLSFNTFAYYDDGNDRRIIVNNLSSYTIVAIKASNVGRQYYGRDRLGRDVLYPGESEFLDLDDNSGYCRFDFEINTTAGTIHKFGVNVCEIVEYDIYD